MQEARNRKGSVSLTQLLANSTFKNIQELGSRPIKMKTFLLVDPNVLQLITHIKAITLALKTLVEEKMVVTEAAEVQLTVSTQEWPTAKYHSSGSLLKKRPKEDLTTMYSQLTMIITPLFTDATRGGLGQEKLNSPGSCQEYLNQAKRIWTHGFLSLKISDMISLQ